MNLTVDENFEELAAAIVDQAIVDYDRAKKTIRRSHQTKSTKVIDALRTMKDVKTFLCGEWFKQLAPHIDGPALLKKMDENFVRYGTCKPFKEEEKEGS